MLNVQWPTVLQGLFKGFYWITHIAPKVPHALLLSCCSPTAVSYLRRVVACLRPVATHCRQVKLPISFFVAVLCVSKPGSERAHQVVAM